MKKLIITIFILQVFLLQAQDLDLKVGGGNLVVTETGEFNKDNQYIFDYFLIGPAYYFNLGSFQIYNFLGYQLPTRVTFMDALGEDPNNYLENKFYYGFKNNLGVSYPVKVKSFLFKPAIFFNFDYFYIQGLESKEEYIYSYAGNGISMDIGYHIGEKVALGIFGGGAYNYFDISGRDSELIYSYSWYLGCTLEVKF